MTASNASDVPRTHTTDTLLRRFVYGRYVDDVVVMEIPTGDDAGVYYYVTDSRYSAVALTNSSSGVVEGYKYTAFGRMTVYGSTCTGTPLSGSGYAASIEASDNLQKECCTTPE